MRDAALRACFALAMLIAWPFVAVMFLVVVLGVLLISWPMVVFMEPPYKKSMKA